MIRVIRIAAADTLRCSRPTLWSREAWSLGAARFAIRTKKGSVAIHPNLVWIHGQMSSSQQRTISDLARRKFYRDQ